MILQAVEVATAILMGMPALLKEGMSWREVRLRAMHADPDQAAAPAAAPAAPRRRPPQHRKLRLRQEHQRVDELRAVVDAELAVDPLKVGLDRLGAEEQARGRLTGGGPSGDDLGHLPLATR